METLTKELLESLGYQRLKMNVANDAGEVDVEGEFITRLPVADKSTKIIAECKAHKDPLNMTDWLKFLGKVFLTEANNEDVVGCLVALSGVNGNVLGSHDALKRKNIRLVDSTVLIEYLSKTYGLSPRAELQRYLTPTGRTYLSVNLAYYKRRVYWVIGYDNGQYTVLEADGSYPSDPTLDLIKPMVEDRFEGGTFVDLRQEEGARRARLLARKLVITGAMIGNGSTTVDDVVKILDQQKLTDEVSKEEVATAVTDIVNEGLMALDDETKAVKFVEEIDTDLELRRKLFVEFGRERFVTLPLGCDWWDRHVDEQLMLQACKVQADLKLDDDSQRKATELMRLSPSALIYALLPDPMIVTHHQGATAVPTNEDMLAHDRNHFMRSLYNHLMRDFRTANLAKYFHSQRRIEALARKTHLTVYNRDDAIVIDAEVADTSMIGEWHEKSPSGDPIYVHLSALPDYAERRRAAAAERTKDASQSSNTGSPAAG